MEVLLTLKFVVVTSHYFLRQLVLLISNQRSNGKPFKYLELYHCLLGNICNRQEAFLYVKNRLWSESVFAKCQEDGPILVNKTEGKRIEKEANSDHNNHEFDCIKNDL